MTDLSRTTVTAHDGHTFDALMAMPAAGHGPGVVLIQEIFGLNAFIREIAGRLAAEGFVVYAPDLFARIRPGVDLTDQGDDLHQAFELFGQFDLDLGVKDIEATIAAMRADHAVDNGKVGCVGFCLGGKLALLTATRTSVDASVSYYGVNLDDHLAELPNVTCALAMHFAGEDEFFPAEGQAKVRAATEWTDNITIYDYPGQHHAFARTGGDHYDRGSAETAWSRTLATLDILRH